MTWRNPFRFVSTKPPFMELWTKIKATYTSSIEGYSIKEVRLKIFFHLSSGEWAEKKTVLMDQSSLLSMLRNSMTIPNQGSYTPYEGYLEVDDIPNELYLVALNNRLTKADFREVFDIEVGIFMESNISRAVNSIAWKIDNKLKVLESFIDYINIVPIQTQQEVYDIYDLKEYIFESILKNNTTMAEFRIGATNEAQQI